MIGTLLGVAGGIVLGDALTHRPTRTMTPEEEAEHNRAVARAEAELIRQEEEDAAQMEQWRVEWEREREEKERQDRFRATSSFTQSEWATFSESDKSTREIMILTRILDHMEHDRLRAERIELRDELREKKLRRLGNMTPERKVILWSFAAMVVLNLFGVLPFVFSGTLEKYAAIMVLPAFSFLAVVGMIIGYVLNETPATYGVK